MIHWRFTEYLKEVLSLTAAVYETPSFPYSEGLGSTIFPPVSFNMSSIELFNYFIKLNIIIGCGNFVFRILK